ncbi:MAG: DNA translocase FtsK [Bacilli bacterium]|nr:DNA translocase FtsK [Bacilli bacterium]
MAKKKKRKENKKKNSGYQVELKGLGLILVAIIGFGRFGMVGKLFSAFAVFLVGTWYNVLLVAVLIVGIYMMMKRDKPDFFTTKLMGLYVFAIGLLIFSHLDYVVHNDLKDFEILKETVNNFMASTKTIMNVQGGGIVGSICSLLFVKLFDIKGTQIVTWALLICGTVMFTGMSIADMIKIVVTKSKSAREKHKLSRTAHDEEETPDKGVVINQDEQPEVDDRVVVASMDELIGKKEEPKLEEIPYNPETGEVLEQEKPYVYPSFQLLAPKKKAKGNENTKMINENTKILEQVCRDFGIVGKVVAANVGPNVTQYEMDLKSGTRVNKILSIEKEIALALAAKSVHIQAPIPGKRTVGIELPNRITTMVTVREILEQIPSEYRNSKLLAVLGRDIMNKPQWFEINKTPHLLVAGSTGSGKSVCINSIITSVLMRAKPDEVKLVLIDPKKVELSMYNGIPHLLAPVVTDPKKANIALKKIVVEMDRRYELFSETGTKNIGGYNAKLDKENAMLADADKKKKMPYIVVIIDELADLMLVAAKEVEDSIMRITQMARAAGIHLIVATQRPSTDVITGVVKANIPSRISFAVSSGIDSRTILDMQGAEKLLGKGDMLFLPQGENTPIRIQGTYIDESEIQKVVDHTIKQQKAHYDNTLIMDSEEMNATTMVGNDRGSSDAYEEPLYNDIVEFVVTQGKASASLLQRRFHLGYNRAARCIDLLEERGIIGPSRGSKPREVLVKVESDSSEEA